VNKQKQNPLKKYVLGSDRDGKKTFGIYTESGKKERKSYS